MGSSPTRPTIILLDTPAYGCCVGLATRGALSKAALMNTTIRSLASNPCHGPWAPREGRRPTTSTSPAGLADVTAPGNDSFHRCERMPGHVEYELMVTNVFSDPMTVEEVYAFTDRQPDEEKWELIDGEPVMNASPVDYHQMVVANLITALMIHQRATGATWHPMPGIGTHVPASKRSLPQPPAFAPGIARKTFCLFVSRNGLSADLGRPRR